MTNNYWKNELVLKTTSNIQQETVNFYCIKETIRLLNYLWHTIENFSNIKETLTSDYIKGISLYLLCDMQG